MAEQEILAQTGAGGAADAPYGEAGGGMGGGGMEPGGDEAGGTGAAGRCPRRRRR